MFEVDIYRMQPHGLTNILTCSVAQIDRKNKREKERIKECMHVIQYVYMCA
jgi:hypothetical protein